MNFKNIVRVAVTAAVGMLSVPSAHAATGENPVAPLRIISQPFNLSGATGTRFVIKVPASISSTPNAVLQLRLHRRVAQRQSFQAIASGEATSAALDTLNFSLSSVSRISNGYFSIPVPITVAKDNASSLYIPNDGVYPISVRVLSADNTVLGQTMTYVNKRQDPRTMEAVQASTLVRLVAPPSITTKGEFEVSDAARQAMKQTIDFLKSVDTSVTVAIQPEIIASFNASISATDKELLATLVSQLRSRTVIASSYIPLDAAMLASGSLDDDFIRLLRMGESTLSQLLPNISLQRNTYVADSYLTDATIDMMYKAGVSAIILTRNAQAKASYESSFSVLSRPNNAQLNMSVVAADPQLSTVIDATSNISVGVEAGYRIAAEMLVQRDDLLSQGIPANSIRMLMSTPTGVPPINSSLVLASNTLAISPGMSMRDFSTPQTVTSQTPVIRFAHAVGQPAPRAVSISSLKAEILSTSSMTKENDPLRTKWDQLLAAGSSTVASDPNAYLMGLRNSLADTRGAVTITTPSRISLSSKDGVLRLQMRNGSTSDLTVIVRLSSAKVTFENPVRAVTLTAGGTTELQVAATTRTNGRFPISLRVSTPEGGQQVLPSVTITARVNALAGFGQAVSVGVLLILIAWWWSHRRKARLGGEVGTTVS